MDDFYAKLRKAGASVVVLSGDGERNPTYEALSTVSQEILANSAAYCKFGGVDNFYNLLLYLNVRICGADLKFASRKTLPRAEFTTLLRVWYQLRSGGVIIDQTSSCNTQLLSRSLVEPKHRIYRRIDRRSISARRRLHSSVLASGRDFPFTFSKATTEFRLMLGLVQQPSRTQPAMTPSFKDCRA